MIIVVVLQKKPDDIIQGISKLDYLLKVSVFQRFKNVELERGKQIRINTEHTDQLFSQISYMSKSDTIALNKLLDEKRLSKS
jgi:hypothetical protein